MQTFFQNGDEQINGDGGPALDAHRVAILRTGYRRDGYDLDALGSGN